MSSLSVTDLFSPHGPLARYSGFDYRSQQQRMAEAVDRTLHSNSHLIVEAPTGIGKTLAYLLPSILFSLERGRKGVISTHTKTLQEQLLKKDIPIARSLLDPSFTVAVLKGRRNYLCTTRLQMALQSQTLFGVEDHAELEKILMWASTTEDGDLEWLPVDISREVAWKVSSDADVCSSRRCRSECFFQKAKERFRSADLVIVNHSLFFTLLMRQQLEHGYLFENDFVIFDEAHVLEGVIGAGTGTRLSRNRILALLHRIYNPKSGKGLASHTGSILKTLSHEAAIETESFFQAFRRVANDDKAPDRQPVAREHRIQSSHLVVNTLSPLLQKLHSLVTEMGRDAEDPSLRDECTILGRGFSESEAFINECTEQLDPEFTYWIEGSKGPDGNITLHRTPTEIAGTVKERLFQDGSPIIMTSGTLSIEGSIEYFKTRLGALTAPSMILDSPFDFTRQMRLGVTREIPLPDTEGYLLHLQEWIMESIVRSRGRALVLFTSGMTMHTIAKELSGELEARGWKLLIQDDTVSRHALLEEFSENVSSVLFGLESFWMGVDVPGESLEHVVITRLPFPVPTHPLTAARMELVSARGGNPFTEYSLPEAVLKFRQGVGRLIRSQNDRGMVTILDGRILSKWYGIVFLRSLPRCPIEILSKSGENEIVMLDDDP
jgi:ATP-dependent DNA helicase DinG